MYKLALLRDSTGTWQAKAKRSEDAAKASTPGILQVRRYTAGAAIRADLVYDESHPPQGRWAGTGFGQKEESPSVEPGGEHEDLLRPVLRAGRPVAEPEPLARARDRCRAQLSQLPAELLRPQPERSFPVLIEDGLRRRREDLLRRPSGA